MIDKSEWVTENPKLFEYDSKNQAVDVFVREDPRCPFPFHEEDWYHQGFWFKDFLKELNTFFRRNYLPYRVVHKDRLDNSDLRLIAAARGW